MRFLLLLIPAFFLLCGCMDPISPAGSGQYENPDYPDILRGYDPLPASIAGVFHTDHRIYILVRDGLMYSFQDDDPYLAIPESLVVKDTLLLGITPGLTEFAPFIGTLFISNEITNDIYRLTDLRTGTPEFITGCESILTEMFSVDNGASLILCFLGPEWLARKVNAVTGEVQAEYSTAWPITRAALSTDGERLLLGNSGKQYLIELGIDNMQQIDSFPLPERAGPFVYNTSGNIVVFNQYTIKPRVYLFDGQTKEILETIECINPYQSCSLMPGTDVVLAPRRSDNKVSVLNSANMVFAPSISCFSFPDMVFASENNELVIVVSDSPGRIYIYENDL